MDQNSRPNMPGFDPNDIATTIKRLVDSATEKLSQRTYKRGIIASVSGSKASVYVEGNTTATPGVITLGTYQPKPNDKVLLLSIGETGANLVILGPLADDTTTKRKVVVNLQYLGSAAANAWNQFTVTIPNGQKMRSSNFAVVGQVGEYSTGGQGGSRFQPGPMYALNQTQVVIWAYNGWSGALSCYASYICEEPTS